MTRKRKGKPAVEPVIEGVLPAVLEVVEKQIDILDLGMAVFQQAQRMLPLPSAKELAEMRKGVRPVGRTVYLLWLLQRAILSQEEIATALRNEVEDGAEEVQIESFSTIHFNAVEQAIQYVRGAGALRPEE